MQIVKLFSVGLLCSFAFAVAAEETFVIKVCQTTITSYPIQGFEAKVALNDKNVGNALFKSYGGQVGTIDLVYVVQEHRRKGCGTQLVKAAINTLKECGCQRIETHTFANKEAVYTLFKQFGFKPTGMVYQKLGKKKSKIVFLTLQLP